MVKRTSALILVATQLAFPESNAPITRNVIPISAIIIVTAHAEPDESLFVIRSPIAASIQPQIKNISNVERTVANTGAAFPSMKKPGFA